MPLPRRRSEHPKHDQEPDQRYREIEGSGSTTNFSGTSESRCRSRRNHRDDVAVLLPDVCSSVVPCDAQSARWPLRARGRRVDPTPRCRLPAVGRSRRPHQGRRSRQGASASIAGTNLRNETLPLCRLTGRKQQGDTALPVARRPAADRVVDRARPSTDPSVGSRFRDVPRDAFSARAERFPDHRRQLEERALAVAAERRAVHERERPRLERGEPAQRARRCTGCRACPSPSGRTCSSGSLRARARRCPPPSRLAARRVEEEVGAQQRPVDLSKNSPASQPCGTCGVERNRRRWRPVSQHLRRRRAHARAGRRSRSTITVAPTKLHTACACGATRSHSFSAPHSSDSKWLKPIHRSLAGSITATPPRRDRKHLPHPGVHQEGLVVVDEELVELDAEVGMEGRDAVDGRGDLGDGARHGVLRSPCCPSAPSEAMGSYLSGLAWRERGGLGGARG